MYTGEDLARSAREILPKKWGYIWGKAGVKWTAEMQDEMDRTSDKKYESARRYGRKWVGHYVADCSGLIKYLCKQFKISVPHGSNSMWRDSLFEKGDIRNTIPVGALVFKLRNGDDFYHVGIYVGNGEVVESKSTYYGVVTSNLTQWTHYGLVKGIGYTTNNRDEVVKLKPGKAIVDVPNDGTVNIRKAPTTSSTNLGVLREGDECEVVAVDGDWAEVRYQARGYIMSKFLVNKGGES